jgi:DNA repair protein RadC
MKEAGKMLEIQILDHIIFGGLKYFSFADEGML